LSGLGFLLAAASSADRMDTWVLKFSLGILAACLVGVGLWHLGSYLAGKRSKRRRAVRQSPEPPSSGPALKVPPSVLTLAGIGPTETNPERLQAACHELEDSLAEMYLELAESWMSKGEPGKAEAALKKVLQICPERPQARLAEGRLSRMVGSIQEHPK
jgi:hypothetical protein